RDMLPGEFFRHDDFLPRGTRPGLAGAVPSGKVSLVLPAERFPGIEALRRGDRCHIVGSVPIDLGGMAGQGTTVVIAASLQDRVVDSRLADGGAAVRRRRECLACGRRFTTYERADAEREQELATEDDGPPGLSPEPDEPGEDGGRVDEIVDDVGRAKAVS
ncbi:MAG: hypothetical protein K6T92_07965, partial [Candidatus Rokubacteria bacterium]|nr:hypothetical protein [Candidatus Rokubacteria bacterium]